MPTPYGSVVPNSVVTQTPQTVDPTGGTHKWYPFGSRPYTSLVPPRGTMAAPPVRMADSPWQDGCAITVLALALALAPLRTVHNCPQDYFEYTPGILRALVRPEVIDRLHAPLKVFPTRVLAPAVAVARPPSLALGLAPTPLP